MLDYIEAISRKTRYEIQGLVPFNIERPEISGSEIFLMKRGNTGRESNDKRSLHTKLVAVCLLIFVCRPTSI